ncbi:MAG: hypothetical protein KC877_01785 [Candidatus Kaiserbacteria bacterium]|nr:hypothetical protein [Candidatus Kaiserbacteria bacterium]MCB9815919.1 hypothetical protein [Candidatus Nomurabacteria bacterium]
MSTPAASSEERGFSSIESQPDDKSTIERTVDPYMDALRQAETALTDQYDGQCDGG